MCICMLMYTQFHVGSHSYKYTYIHVQTDSYTQPHVYMHTHNPDVSSLHMVEIVYVNLQLDFHIVGT